MDNSYRPLIKISKREIFNAEANGNIYIQRPTLLAIYCKSNSDEILDDVRLMYFREPSTASYPLDLHVGIEDFRQRRIAKITEQLNKVENYVLKSEDDVLKIDGNGHFDARQSTIILTQRGLLVRLMDLPYRLVPHTLNDQLIYAIKYCGIICLIEPPSSTIKQKKNFHHNKFAQYCFSNSPDEEPNTNSIINENQWHFGIHRTTLKNFNIIYSSEFLGIISEHKIENVHDISDLNKLRFVMTKTMFQSNDRGYHYKRRLMSRWWFQAYLSNTNDIYVGLKNEDGIIHGPVEHKRAQDLPKIVDINPLICNQFLHKFLTLVERTMWEVDCPYTVYEFKYDSSVLDIKYKVNKGKSELSFLSQEFIEHLKTRNVK